MHLEMTSWDCASLVSRVNLAYRVSPFPRNFFGARTSRETLKQGTFISHLYTTGTCLMYSYFSRKPSEPPPPYPPPSPFAPLDTTSIDSQIGLLRNFYIQRINTHAARTAPTQPPPFVTPPAPAPSQLEIELAREMGTEPPVPQVPPPIRNPAAPDVVLPDDAPPAARTKSGPLGQIMRPSASSGLKKKPKTGSGSGSGGATKEGPHGPAGPGPGIPPPLAAMNTHVQPVIMNGPTSGSGMGGEGYAVLPGSSGLATGGDTGRKSASPKKKAEQSQNPNQGQGQGQMPSFVAANA